MPDVVLPKISGGFVADQKRGFPPEDFASLIDRDDGEVYEFILPDHNREKTNRGSNPVSKITVKLVERVKRS